jgi:SNF2 family DNA or RNA helicase
MIENAFVHAFIVPQPPPNPLFNDITSGWPPMKLDLHRRSKNDFQIHAIDPSKKIFGNVDAKTAVALCPLLDSAEFPVEFTARLDTRKKVPGEIIGEPTSGIYRVSISLYGQRQHANAIGKFMGQRNVWLGTPPAVAQGTTLYNPHVNIRRQMNAAAAASNSTTGRLTARYESRTAEEVNDAVMKMFDQLITKDIPTMEPSPHILTPLLPHQKQALWFMTEKEKPRKFGPNEEENNSLWRMVDKPGGGTQYREIITGLVLDGKPEESFGGLLADMMGLGKTLSVLSLITASLESSLEWKRLAPHPSLVRAIPGIRNTRTTLLVVPLSAVSNWTTQINEHLEEGCIKFHTFHGPNRITDLDELAKFDVLITTYSTILSEMNGRGAKRGDSPLRRMNMFRIVLDEAHTIREQNARQTKAILDLNAERKWSVTGTPIQNRLEDLLSVTKFLRIYPYNERSNFVQHILSPFKSGDPNVLTNLRVLVDSFTLRRVKDRINLPPRNDNMVTLEFTEQEKQLHEFFRNESNVMMRVIAGESKSKMGGRMYHHVLKAMMILRQVSAHGKELLDIEDRERIKGLSVHDAIDLEEGEPAETPAALDKKAYGMFAMRQDMAEDVCATETCNKNLEPILAANGEVDPYAPMAIYLPCGCVFCPTCFSGWKEVFDSNSEAPVECPGCKGWTTMAYSVITPNGLEKYQAQQDQERRDRQSGKIGKVFGEYEGPHTKTIALLNYLKGSVEDSKQLEGEPPIKSVVFSGWTSHLDLIEIALRNNGLDGFVRLDGTMTLGARMKALDLFAKDDSITILLATIGAGGVGLNLTSASRVFIMEPQYNPAAVAQAVDRVHRLGQTRPVETYQFVMKGSIEEKIQELAKKKQQLADMSMNRGKMDKREVQEARMREYRSLFK